MFLRKNNRSFKESAAYNKQTYLQYVNRLTELSLSMFEWKNLPDTIDERFLELTLFNDGWAVFFEDEDLGYLALQATIGGRLNVYRIPIARTAIAPNGYRRKLNIDNSVIIFNNMIHTNAQLEVQNYARRLWDLDRTIDINAKAQKTPVLVTCNDKQKLTLQNLYMQYEGNEPVIFGYDNLNTDAIKSIQTGAPYVADKLYTLKTQIWNEALTYLGISNVNYNKKERMVTDEVLRNQGGVVASRYSRLESRRKACKEINKMFGLNITCDYRQDYQTIDESANDTLESDNDEREDSDG